MRVKWRIAEGVEYQVYEPDDGARSHGGMIQREALLFCPGLPGMGGAVFEQRHAAALVEEGYVVHVIKHRGTKFASPMAPQMINNAARLAKGRKDGHAILGGAPVTIDDWLMEPFYALKDIADGFDVIHIIGNSFGALAALHSLAETGAPLSKVRSVLLYAGAQGIDDGEDGIMRIWQPEFLMAGRITDKVALNDPFDIVETIRNLYAVLPEKTMRLPEHIRLTYLVVDRDELLNIEDTKKFQSAVGGRGTIVIDTVDHAWPEHNLMAHDTPNYTTDDLLELIRG